MRFAILSHGDEKMDKWKKISFANKEKYCKKYDYDFIGSSEKFDDRPPQWHKLSLIKKHLPKYDWVFWSDPDSLIINTDVKLQSYIDDNYDFIAGMFRYINIGQFFVKNSELGNKIINDIDNQKQYIGLAGNEESACKHLFGTKEYTDILPKIKLIKEAGFNKMPDNFKAWDIIMHYAGHHKDYNHFKELSKYINY